MQPLLTERILNSSLDCSTKCYLLLHGQRGKKTEYEVHADEFDGMYQRAAITRLEELTPDKDTLHLKGLTSSAPWQPPSRHHQTGRGKWMAIGRRCSIST